MCLQMMELVGLILGIVTIITDPEKDKDYQDSVANTKQDLPDVCPRRGNRIEGLKEKRPYWNPILLCLCNEK